MSKRLISDQENIRADKYLASVLNKSRTEIQKMFEDGLVLINDKQQKPSYPLKLGDVINYDEKEEVTLGLTKKDFQLDIVYEDQDVIVINKPSGMVVHPAHGHYDDTLVNGLLYHCTDLSSINGVIRPGIVHRIDKDTSGLLVACKNNEAHQALAKQLQEKTCSRKYLAIVFGTFNHTVGRIDAPIARDPKNRQKQAVVEGGKEAITNFTVLERLGEYSLVECRLETGRTHQIRVHMAYIGHPVLGDPLYASKKLSSGSFGQYLHAFELSFIHPRTGKVMTFNAEPPKEFLEKVAELKK